MRCRLARQAPAFDPERLELRRPNLDLHPMTRRRGWLAWRWVTRVWVRRAVALAAGALACPGAAADTTFWDALSSPAEMRAFAGELSDEELLAQVFILGYPGTRFSPTLQGMIEQRGLGGVKIFPRNVAGLEQLAATIDRMQEAARRQPRQIPLFIATDQEGGWIRHIKHTSSVTPGNLALGAGRLPGDAFQTGRYIGSELAALGINMNFAPTVDVYSHPEATVIGPRAFSSDPVVTGLLAVAFFRGLQSAGIVATAKHFPGHGAADRDSHLVLPQVDADLAQLWQRELVPYRFLVREGVPAIMSGHLAFPAITGNQLPASQSPLLVRELLRDRLGFTGIVITDDLEMNGALQVAGSPARAALRALEAGNDMLLLSHSPEWQRRTWELARERMRTDDGFRRRVLEAAGRVLEAKRAAFTADPPAPVRSATVRLEERLPAPGAAEFFLSAAARAVTVVRDAGLPLPAAAAERGRTLLVGQHPAFITAGRRRYPDAESATFPYSPFYRAIDPHRWRIPLLARTYNTVIFELANYNSLQILQRMESLADRLTVVSTLTPVYLREVPWVRTAVAVYGTGADSFLAGFAVLGGDYPAAGRLPLHFPDPAAAAGDTPAGPALPQPNRAPPQPNQAPPQPNRAPPQPNRALPQPNRAPPQPNRAPPQPNRALPQPNRAPPQPNRALPQPNRAPPQPNRAPPQPNRAPPQPGVRRLPHE